MPVGPATRQPRRANPSPGLCGGAAPAPPRGDWQGHGLASDSRREYLDASLAKANASADSLVSRPLYSQLPGVDDYVRRLWADNDGPDGEGDDDPGGPPPKPSS